MMRVDLTLIKVHGETLDEGFFKSWLGGYGLGVRIIYSDIAPKTDPLGLDNILEFEIGLLTGTLTSLGSDFSVLGKLPLTGTWGDSRTGGFFS
jgi:aldehyde:ferredoxin oxidoreductase